MLLEAMVPQPTKKARHSHNHARYARATRPQGDKLGFSSGFLAGC